jgi:hypothetical protein
MWRLIRFGAGKRYATSLDPTVVKKWPDGGTFQHNSTAKRQNLKGFHIAARHI